MKRFLTVIASGILLSSFTLFSSLDDLVNAMKSGNTGQITKYFDNTIEISVPGKSGSYSKSQAELVLKDFFSTNPVKSFEEKHRGQNLGSQYCIGDLVTKNGVFRTTIFMKQKGDKLFLQQMRFEM